MANAAPRSSEPNSAPITHLLGRIAAGDRPAAEELFNAVYDDLRAKARNRIQKSPDVSLEPTELVHEACLRLMGPAGIAGLSFENRRHLYGSAARAMMQVLSNHVRDKNAAIRKAPGVRIALDESVTDAPTSDINILELEGALVRLDELKPDLAEIFYLHALAGLTHEQVGQVIGKGPQTAKQMYAKALGHLRKPDDGQPRAAG